MRVNRRDLLKAGGALAAATALPATAFAQAAFAPKPGAWRNFQTVTRVELGGAAGGASQAWVPLPAFSEPEWFKPGGSTWATNGKAETKRDSKYGAEFLHVAWAQEENAPVVQVTSRFSTRDRAVDLSRPGNARPLSDADRRLYTAATALIPVDGIVKQTSDKITAGATSEIDKARRIYEWIVDTTERNPKTRGCGVGDIASMLKSGNLFGKCADLNALYVGLARAAGLPARDVYGLRVAPSQFGYRAWVPVPRSSPRRSTAVPRSTSRASVGCRSIRPTCARSCSKSRRPTSRSPTPKSWQRARPCSVRGR